MYGDDMNNSKIKENGQFGKIEFMELIIPLSIFVVIVLVITCIFAIIEVVM